MMATEPMSPEELFMLLNGGSLDGGALDERADMEKTLKGLLANLSFGGQDPTAFEDVETGRTTVDLPSRASYDRYRGAPSGTVEWNIANSIDRNDTPSAYGQSYRDEVMISERARMAESGKDEAAVAAAIDDPAFRTRIDKLVSDAQKDYTRAWEENSEFVTAANRLDPEGQRALSEGRGSYEKVEFGESKARKYFTDQGLSAPTDRFTPEHFGVNLQNDQNKVDSARGMFQQLRGQDLQAASGRSESGRPGRPGGAAKPTAWGDLTASARYKRKSAGDDLVAANRAQHQNRTMADGQAAILDKYGRSPFTEQIRARLGMQ